MSYRVGIGYDIHLFAEGRRLFIGGVEIPYIKGLLGHSDGDVLLHAICDALLGAAGEKDIGQYFPDTDAKFRGISSLELLKTVADLIKDKNFLINNVDSVVVAQEPLLAPFKKKMQSAIAKALHLSEDKISIKAKTNEGIGTIGRKEAIASYAVVSLTTKESV